MSRPKYDVTCPTCGEGPNLPCRTLRTFRVTDTHISRIEADHAQMVSKSVARRLAVQRESQDVDGDSTPGFDGVGYLP